MIPTIILLASVAILGMNASQSPKLTTQFTDNFKQIVEDKGMTDDFSYGNMTADETANLFTTMLDNLSKAAESSAHDTILKLIGTSIRNNFPNFNTAKNVDVFGNYAGNTLLEIGLIKDDDSAKKYSDIYANGVVKSLNDLSSGDRNNATKRIQAILTSSGEALKNVNEYSMDTVPVFGILLAYEMYTQ